MRPFFCLCMYPLRCGLLERLTYPPAVTSWLAPVPASLRWLLVPVVVVAGVILVRVSVPPPENSISVASSSGSIVTLVAAALPVRLPGGVHATITTAPILAALFDPGLVNPFGVCWVAFIGSFEPRDLRGDPKWYGTLFNRADWVLSAFAGWTVLAMTQSAVRPGDPLGILAQTRGCRQCFRDR